MVWRISPGKFFVVHLRLIVSQWARRSAGFFRYSASAFQSLSAESDDRNVNFSLRPHCPLGVAGLAWGNESIGGRLRHLPLSGPHESSVLRKSWLVPATKILTTSTRA